MNDAKGAFLIVFGIITFFYFIFKIIQNLESFKSTSEPGEERGIFAVILNMFTNDNGTGIFDKSSDDSGGDGGDGGGD